jgi:hypothetical protein
MYSTIKRKINNKLRRHKLLPRDVRRKLRPLGSTDGRGNQAFAVVKYFTADGDYYWYATEFDGEDLFFGLVFGPFVEMGYFSLTELEEARGPLDLPVERDQYFLPVTLEIIIQQHRQREGDVRQYLV